LKQIPSRAPAGNNRYDQNTIDNSLGSGRYANNPPIQNSQNYRFFNQYRQVKSYQPYGVQGFNRFQYAQQDRRSRQTYNSMGGYGQNQVDPSFVRPYNPGNQIDSGFIQPGGIKASQAQAIEQIKNAPKPVEGTQFRMPHMPGIADIKFCSNNTIEGLKECHQTCRGSIKCLPSGCFCAINLIPFAKQADSSESRAVRINPFTKSKYAYSNTFKTLF